MLIGFLTINTTTLNIDTSRLTLKNVTSIFRTSTNSKVGLKEQMELGDLIIILIVIIIISWTIRTLLILVNIPGLILAVGLKIDRTQSLNENKQLRLELLLIIKLHLQLK
jgi:hypothetical protein